MNREEAKQVIKDHGGLRPCPFCGGRASLRPRVINDNIDEFYIKCTKCRAKSMRSVLLLNAVDAWNARVDERPVILLSGGRKGTKKFKKWFK